MAFVDLVALNIEAVDQSLGETPVESLSRHKFSTRGPVERDDANCMCHVFASMRARLFLSLSLSQSQETKLLIS